VLIVAADIFDYCKNAQTAVTLIFMPNIL
jgi:hypothetical protein